MKVTQSKELGQAIKSDQDTIEIVGDLSKKVVKIKATGKIAWAIAAGAIVVAIVSVMAVPATGGTSAALNIVSAPAAVSILGASTASAAIAIGVAGGGIGALNKLRSYKIVEKTDGRVVLQRK